MLKRSRAQYEQDGVVDGISLFQYVPLPWGVQDGVQPLIFGFPTQQNIDVGGDNAGAPTKMPSYQIFHAYATTGQNPLSIQWTRPYTDITGVKLNRVTFPLSFLLFSADQTVSYTVTGQGSSSITVPAGNYAFSELQAWFAQEATYLTLQIKKTAANFCMMYVLASSGTPSFTLNFTSAPLLKQALGFSAFTNGTTVSTVQQVSRMLGTSVSGCGVVGTSTIVLSLPPFVYLQVNTFASQRKLVTGMETGTGSSSLSNIVAAIPCDGNTGDVLTYEPTNQQFFDTHGSLDYLWETFSLLNPDGSAINFQGAPWDVEIGVNVSVVTPGEMSTGRLGGSGSGVADAQSLQTRTDFQSALARLGGGAGKIQAEPEDPVPLDKGSTAAVQKENNEDDE